MSGELLQQYKLYVVSRDASCQARFEINHAGYGLLQSACFRKSGGQTDLYHLP